jgi:hypothetical protein
MKVMLSNKCYDNSQYAHVSAASTSQDVPWLRETAYNTERYV